MRFGDCHQRLRKGGLALSLVALSCGLSGCYIFNFFKHGRNGDGGEDAVFSGTVLGQSLGSKAGAVDEAALATVYGVSTTHAPAAVRPDPDLFVRRFIRQYRPEGATVARQIGKVEQFRLLLGGATQDFSTTPQESYDATSLLAVQKVAEETCRGLVAPNSSEHPGWKTILPYPPDQEQLNIAWLAQRVTGRPSATIDPSVLQALTAIMVAEEPYITENGWGSGNAYAKYIPVCAALTVDADSLYL